MISMHTPFFAHEYNLVIEHKSQSTFQESEKLKSPKFANFPSVETRENGAGFKLSADMPFEFSGEDKEKKEPRIRFRSEEELRYQNDYFKLPELSLYGDYDDNSISNELFPEFEAPKLNSKKVSGEMDFKRYAEPLSYMNPMDKFHNNNDIEMFSASERTPAMAYKRAEPKYSHYQRKSSPHVETRPAKLSGEGYKPPKPPLHRTTPDFPQDNPGFFKLPKLGPGTPGGGFPRPPAEAHHLRRQDPSDLRPKKTSQPRVEAPLPNLPPTPRTSRPFTPKPATTPKPRWTVQRPTPRSTAIPVPTSSVKAAWGPNDIGFYDYNDYNYYDEQDYQDYYDYKDPPRNENFPEFSQPRSIPKANQQRGLPDLIQTRKLLEPKQYRSLPELPQSRTLPEPEPRYLEPSLQRSFSKPLKSARSSDGSREKDFHEIPESRSYQERPSQVPAPLGPPPAILEMQHDSVFSAPFDVPKLGSNMAYTPPEVIYNEMHSQPRGRSIQDRAFKTSSNFKNNFNSLDPFRKDVRPKRKPSLPTPVPFLPTPPKSNKVHTQGPFSEYGSIYDSPQKSVKKQGKTYLSPKISVRPTVPTFEEPPQDFFRPISAPSITFEPTQETYNEKILHNLVAKELDSGNQQADVFLPFIEEEDENFPPAPNQQMRNTLYHDYDSEPRYKRYQSVDYSPQFPEDYASYDNFNYEPQRFDSKDPFSESPTPQPLSFDSEVASFLPPPEDFVAEHRSLPDFHSPDYYSPDYYKGGDYYSPEYHTSDYSSEEYYPIHGGDYNYVGDYGNDFHQDLDAVAPDFHTAPLGPPPHQPILSFGDKTDITQNSNQFINVASPDKFEHGHVRGNPVHKKQEYTRREGRQFKSQVSALYVVKIS